MTKDEVLKARSAQYDARLRVAVAQAAIDRLSRAMTDARSEYDAAQVALNTAQNATERAELTAIGIEARKTVDAMPADVEVSK